MSYNCSYKIGNLGIDCFTLMKKAVKIFFVPYYNSVGGINYITLGAGPYNNAFFTALINQVDPSKRLIPSPLLRNAMNKRDASIVKTYDDNSSVVVQKGVRKFSAIIASEDGASPIILGKLLSQRKQKIGMFILDLDGNYIGAVNAPGFLSPIMIDNNSIDPIFNMGEDKDPTELAINFNISSSEIDANLAALDATVDISPDANLFNMEGLLDVNPVYTNLSITGWGTGSPFTVTLNELFGSANTLTAVHGVLSADLAAIAVSGTGVFSGTGITSIAEVKALDGEPTGVYNIVLNYSTPPVAGDKIKLTFTLPGYDWLVANNTIITLIA